NRFYNFVVEADATDAAGETHHGETSLPLSDRPTAFSVTMPAKIEADSTAKVTFHYLNNAGKPIEGKVSYSLKDETLKTKENKTVAANETFEMRFNALKSGCYTLEATCGEDTLKQEFIVFSMKDKQPVVQTHDWFYASAEEFPSDGRPIYIQMGSSDKDQHIVYSLFSGDKVLESGVIDQSNAITTRQFTYKKEYGDGALFTCAWVRDGKLYTHQAQLRQPLPDKRLKLTWKTFRDRLTPGQKEEWTLHVEKMDGNASLVAVLFDRSLDDIRRHSWKFGPSIWRSVPSTQWLGRRATSYSLYGEQPYKSLAENALRFTHFDGEMFDFMPRAVFSYDSRAGGVRIRGTAPMMAKAAPEMVEESGNVLREVDLSAGMQKKSAMTGSVAANDAVGTDDSEAQKSTSENTQVRENLNETAFFYPSLMTDKNGDISLKFTLPESITTWRFMGLATDREVRHGTLESEVVAKKDVMIQPNMPRFLRTGDKGQIAARIFNTGEKTVKGTATIELLEPETEKVVYSQNTLFSVETGKTTAVKFDVDAASEAIAAHSLLVCRVSASGNGFSDGEQHYLPILPDYELVINTVPFTQHGPGTKTIDLTKLFGSSGVQKFRSSSNTQHPSPNTLTVEYTNNPAWLMIQTLPTVASASDVNAISQAAAYYANSLAENLLKQSPNVKKTIELWKREQGAETSLMSSLEKNQELKTMVLDETPWVADAKHEADQKRLLSDYFDENNVRHRLDNNLTNLRKLQNSDGSWSWWPGMQGSFYMTVAVSKMFVRLNAMLSSPNTQKSSPETAEMLEKAYSYMGQKILKEVAEMKEAEKKGAKNLRPSETAIEWLYLTTLDGRKLSARVQEAKDYLVNRLSKQTKDFTIYGKA
ncbi:MAG: alpha-2-macroglobulin, partial [Prevotella sp.]|nr:alpha-2-macroglobulin [Prevotella sp.]